MRSDAAVHTAGVHEARSPAARILDGYLETAVDAEASDLHLEPAANGLAVRMRVDGRLRPLPSPPPGLTAALLTRIRLLAGVDIAERRLPEDGRFVAAYANVRVEIRAAFLPVEGGERVTLRLLRTDTAARSLDDLGLERPARAALEAALGRPSGLTLVVGPTGSGKTTTMYAALESLRSPELAIVTVEDPVERDLAGVAQVGVDEDCGRTFARVLRAMLRHDPDVLLVGEMRDTDSARIACRAALTGHRVLTTLHATDTREAVVRLLDMGVPAYLLEATLALVVSQRLLRLVCTNCAVAERTTPEEAEHFHRAGLQAPRALVHARGCARCAERGYRGRTAVFETLSFINRDGAPLEALRPHAPLLGEGLRLAAEGRTTLAEVVTTCPTPAA